MENNGENSGPLTSLPVDRLMATDCNGDRSCQYCHITLYNVITITVENFATITVDNINVDNIATITIGIFPQ